MSTVRLSVPLPTPVRWHRRAIALFAVAATTTGMAACGSSKKTSTSPTTAAASAATSGASSKHLTVAFVMGAEADPFFISMHRGATAEAQALGISLIWQGDPSEYSPATQIPIVDQVLAEKPSALILSPTDPAALQPAVNQSIAQGIPVLNIDTHVTDLSKVVSFITGDNTQGGAAAADAMATAMHYAAGQSYQVVVGASSPTATTNTARLAGFKAEIASKYPGISIVSEAYSESVAATANTNVNNWLTKYPNLKGIFAIDGTNATGAASALQVRNLVGKIALVGYDAYSNNVALLQQHVFAALVAQNPAMEAKIDIDNAVKYIRDGDSLAGIPRTITLPNVVLTPTTPASVLAADTYATS